MIGRLWWIAESPAEVEQWTAEVLSEGGTVVSVKQAPGSEVFDFIFEIDRERAVALHWADGVNADNWLEIDDGIEDTA